MSLRFTVLASGSGGNASLLEVDGFGLLLDIGLGPRQLANRLAAIGASWRQVHAVLLTHTHSDHWNDRTLTHLRRLGIPLFCHASHHDALRAYGSQFAVLQAANLVRTYETERDVQLAPRLSCRPIPLRHDGATFGFRLLGPADLFGQPCALGYAADLGSWTPELAQAFGDVDLLALEFNHDVDLEYASGRAPRLIARVLGDTGHLSNAQAAALLQEVVRRSVPERLQYVVQLHLSRECNRPALALQTAREALGGNGSAPEIHTAHQDRPTATFVLGMTAGTRRPSRGPRKQRNAATFSAPQRWLPGLEPE